MVTQVEVMLIAWQLLFPQLLITYNYFFVSVAVGISEPRSVLPICSDNVLRFSAQQTRVN